jgi:CNT family concentrative nucleoside transporter
MERLQGLLGIVLILVIAVLASNNRRRIDWRLVGTGIALQTAIALLIFKVGPVGTFFAWLAAAWAISRHSRATAPCSSTAASPS